MKTLSGVRLCFVVTALGLCVGATGCDKIINSAASDPEIRQKATDSARTSCVSTMHNNIKTPITPAMDGKITDYCTCFSTKGMEKFSNADLIRLGLDGGKFTPEQKAKIDEGVKICEAQAFGK